MRFKGFGNSKQKTETNGFEWPLLKFSMADLLTDSYRCHNSPWFRPDLLPAIARFATSPTTGFDGRWAPSRGKQFTARRYGLPQNRPRRRARPRTVWPARLGISFPDADSLAFFRLAAVLKPVSAFPFSDWHRAGAATQKIGVECSGESRGWQQGS
jgi:hypothetical protein